MEIHSSAISATLIDELVQQGVTDVVISPGSRSTSLALACINDPRLRCYVRVDERSAAFLALGLSRGNMVTGSATPAVVISTSGTAVANHAPAIHEANNAGVPLIVISADRPEELHGIGENQTMWQNDLHRPYVRRSLTIGHRGYGEDAGTSIRSTAVEAIAFAKGIRGEGAGPVHINVHLREPLTGRVWQPTPLAGISPTIHAAKPALREKLYEVIGLLSSSDRVLVIAGDGVHPEDQRNIVDQCERFGWPLIAEPTSGVCYGKMLIRSGPWLASNADFAAKAKPSVIVVLGRPTLSRDVAALCAGVSHVIQFDPDGRGWNPTRRANHLVYSPISTLLDEVVHQPSQEWVRLWGEADAKAMQAIDMASTSDEGAIFVVRDLIKDLVNDRDPRLLVLGSSSPIRLVNEVVPTLGDVPVVANRGVSGIDGFLSTAVGAALATGRRTLAITGDLSFLHDLSGLVIGKETGEPLPDLTVVVLNNDGGGIFDRLGHLKAVDQQVFRRIFTTPHGLSVALIARSMGFEAVRLTKANQIAPMVSNIPAKPGIKVVEFAYNPSDTRVTMAAIALAIAGMFVNDPAMANTPIFEGPDTGL